MLLFFAFLSLSSCCLKGVFGDADDVKSVMEGDSVTLHADLTHMQKDDLIEWSYKTRKTIIVRVNREANKVSVYDYVHDGMFRDRLQVDDQTGSLTITNITTQHSGLYHITISGKQKTSYTFNVTVYAFLPIPVISSYCSQNPPSSSVSKYVLLCSVMNVSHVEYQDTNTYRCVINNTFTNQTQHLNITQHCQLNQCSDCVCCCSISEAVIRLVISAVVGVATVGFLVYDVKSTRVEKRRRV
ncbi:uncharacterized protein LOC130430407 isoform X2 [Triplophysa dalaica]|uniref:uncharacterized protein LOC130430407 isoform X2 n=1 Tax=Triplophysa dalaica TaxID=1582913 RepID=UPI0024E039C8|nr:uncharacterized protein LOC130430407 isoform X2 [Triplophysa dalaica]